MSSGMRVSGHYKEPRKHRNTLKLHSMVITDGDG